MNNKTELYRLIQEKEKLINSLGFLYQNDGKVHDWQLDFWGADNHVRLLCSANQIGKSTTAIRYVIIHSTHPEGYKPFKIKSWKELYGKNLNKLTIWYFYPDETTLRTEFNEKWNPLLPRNGFEQHPKFGYKIEKTKNRPFALHFYSGASVYFRLYTQDPKNLQSTSVHLLVADEEMPVELYSELTARLFSTKGYFFMVFTATLGQELWRRALEEIGTKRETFKGAWKRTVSMYDCKYYTDGTVRFKDEDINYAKELCSTEQEIQRRIYGRFVVDDDLVYSSFSVHDNVIPAKELDYTKYSLFIGVDIGSGGRNHPSSINFLAVDNNFDEAYVIENKMFTYEHSIEDLIEYIKLKLNTYMFPLVNIFYDYAVPEFMKSATFNGLPVSKAEKLHDVGEPLINSLFKEKRLFIFDIEDNWNLIDELKSLKIKTPKKHAKDDAVDSLRYSIASLPFVFGKKRLDNKKKYDIVDKKSKLKRKGHIKKNIIIPEEDNNGSIYEEFQEWNKYFEI